MEIRIELDIHVAISFGLYIFAFFVGAFAKIKEVIMEGPNAVFSFMAMVWCGLAFLRSLW